jgi:hypothetical protein
LDFSGPGGWDASLMMVMGGAVMVNLATFHLLAGRAGGEAAPLLAGPDANAKFSKVLDMGACKANSNIDARLLAGAAVFGAGWGLAGVCPGPGIVALPSGGATAALFVPALLAGMALYELVLGEGAGGRKHHHHAHSHGHGHSHSSGEGVGTKAAAVEVGATSADSVGARGGPAAASGLRQRQPTPDGSMAQGATS